MDRLDDADDKRLMLALAGGDDAALDALMARWQRPVRGFILRHVSNPADAEDLAQETFVRLFRARARYRPAARFSTFLFTIAVNCCRNHAEKQGRRPTVALDIAQGPSPLAGYVAPGPAPDEALRARERVDAVREAIGELPHELRTAVILFEYENLSHAEIAEIAGVTPKAIETRLYRARRRLRERLARWLRV